MNAQAEIQLSTVWMAVLDEALSNPACLMAGAAMLFAVSPLVAWVAGRFFCRRWTKHAPRAYRLCWCSYGMGLAGVVACYLAAGHLQERLNQARDGAYNLTGAVNMPTKDVDNVEKKVVCAMDGALLHLEILPKLDNPKLSEDERKCLWKCWEDANARKKFSQALAKKRFEQRGAGERSLEHLATLRHNGAPAVFLLLAGLALSCAAAAYRAIRLIPIHPTLTPYLTPQL